MSVLPPAGTAGLPSQDGGELQLSGPTADATGVTLAGDASQDDIALAAAVANGWFLRTPSRFAGSSEDRGGSSSLASSSGVATASPAATTGSAVTFAIGLDPNAADAPTDFFDDSLAITTSAPAVLDNGGATSADYYATGGADKAQVLAALDATNLGYDGAGVTVGVISDSFDDLGGAAAAEADGALPPASDIDVLEDLPADDGGTDEGQAMMEVVHDVASGADLDFYTADLSEQDFANGFLALAAAGCKVICDDVTYLDEPFFQTGVVANAIATVEAEGVTVVTCAGNQASWGYQAAWDPLSLSEYDGYQLFGVQNFGTSADPDPVQTVTNSSGYDDDLLLQWNQPYGDATTDLGVLVFSNGRLIGKYSNANIDGFRQSNFGDGASTPLIALNLPEGANYQIAIEVLSGPNPGLIDDVLFNDTPPSTVTLGDANAGTVFGHHASPDAITDGAVDAANTPGNDGTLQSENFSSSDADTLLYFNYNGGTVAGAPEHLDPIAVSGVDDIYTTVSDIGDFLGTSASTASVAGVVADMLQANPNLTPSEIETILEQTATGFGSSDIAGTGLVNAGAAVKAALALGTTSPPPPSSPPPSSPPPSSSPPPPSSPPPSTSPVVFWTDATTGDTGYWTGNGAAGGLVDLGSQSTLYTAIGIGDFDGSGNLEVLWQDEASGDTGYWTAAGASGGFVDLGSAPSGYQFVGTGDFDGAGYDEVAWEDKATGDTGYWTMADGVVTGFHDFGSDANTNYTVEGTGDFDGAGYDEVLWEDTASGDTGYWTTTDGIVTGFHDFGVAANTSYSIVGIGDFDGDGDDEVLWEDKATGDTGYWTENGAGQVNGFHDFGFANVDYSVIGVGNYNNTGRDEVMWEDTATGDTGFWTINAAGQVTGFDDLGTMSTSYHAIAMNA